LKKLWADHVIGSEDANLKDIEIIKTDNKFVYYYHIILDILI
jgi:hypothetical protein